jgi:hypothetical protein
VMARRRWRTSSRCGFGVGISFGWFWFDSVSGLCRRPTFCA